MNLTVTKQKAGMI